MVRLKLIQEIAEMTIKELKAFLHLSQSLHFHQTAEAIHTSPSTLSRIIQRLEDEFGQKLFERNNRTVTLTKSGKRFISFAQNIVDNWQKLKSEFDEQSQVLSGSLTVYCTVTAAHIYLPKILGDFREKYPEVDINLETGDVSHAFEKVEKEEADIAFAVRSKHLPDRIQFQSIDLIPLAIIAPKSGSYSGLSDWPIDDLESIPFVMPESGPAANRILSWFDSLGVKPPIYAHVSGHEAIVSLVALGCGIGVVPVPVLESSPVKEQVQRLSSPSMPTPFELGVIGLKRNMDNKIIRAFWELIPKAK